MKYKKGDMVKVRDDLELDKKYGIWIFNSKMYKNKGKVCEILKVYEDLYVFTDGSSGYTDKMLLDLTETDFYEGCEIENKHGGIKILAVCGDAYLLSSNDDYSITGEWFTKKELINQGYKIKDFKPKETIKQMTIEEAEKAFNIKIVEGKE